MGESGEICHFLGRTREWYPYQKFVPIPIVQRRSATGTGTSPSGIGTDPSGTGTDPSGTGTNNPVFAYYAPFSLVFVHLLFMDPNKGLMGVHIRKYERDNVPYLAAEAKRNLFSTINC